MIIIRNSNIWKNNEVAADYLKGTRAAIPFAKEELQIILQIIKNTHKEVQSILDVGCGDGILGRTLLNSYPNASITFSDISETMLDAVKKEISNTNNHNSQKQFHFHQHDMQQSDWMNELEEHAPYDVIVSGLAIHHLTHRRKKEIYGDIYDLLAPNGVFLNLERVQSASPLGVLLNNEMYIDSLFSFHSRENPNISREEVAEKYYYRPLKQSNILAPVELQVEWLKELGYVDVDIFFKIYEIAIFGGRKRPLDA